MNGNTLPTTYGKTSHDNTVQAASPSLPQPPVLTVAEVARELRCSKAHVFNVVHGKVRGLPPLPVLRIGRRVLVRHEALRAWLLSLESFNEDDLESLGGA